jgi:uncharacterized protein (DUF362 family)/ferredoxin
MESHARSSQPVAVVRCDSYDIDAVDDAVQTGLRLVGGAETYAQPGEQILLKPNLLFGRAPERCVTTHPSVFQAVAKAFAAVGAHVTYGDSPGFGRPQTAAQRSGIGEVAHKLGIPLAEFSRGQSVSFPEGHLIKQFTLAQGVLEAGGLVSLPKLKAHGLTRITGAIKNQFGCIPGPLKAEFHARLPMVDLFAQMLVDLNLLIKPRLYIMDGIVAMEGNGPQNGSPFPMNVLLFSTDPVALDATVCRLIDLDPELVPTLPHGARLGLGSYHEIAHVGDSVDPLIRRDFVVNRHTASTTETPGRASRWARRLVVPKPYVVADRCTRCGTCVQICPVHPKAIAFHGTGRSSPPVHDYSQCIRCYCCQEMCPDGAIEIFTPWLGRIIH